MTMRLYHSAISIGAAIAGLLLLSVTAPTEAAAAGDCPCIKGSAGICVPDRACEARQRRIRDGLKYSHEYRNGGGGGTKGYRPSVTAAPAPRNGTAADDRAPAIPAPAPRNSTATDYRGPTAAPAVPRHAPPPTVGAGASPAVGADAPPAARPPGFARARPPAAATATAGPASNGGRLRILETGYSHLSELGKEEAGFGLYSYAILPSESGRAAVFLGQLFKEIPSIGETSAQRSQLNIFYVPLKKDGESDFAALLQTSAANAEKLGAEYSRSLYDYRIARALLNHVCNPPADSIRQLCDGDLSRGPYIFTYASPASSMDSVPPPFLFVDLSNVHEQAFGEFIAAFRSQVKRDDITDQARIRTMRLTILDIVLTAADWVSPVEKAIAEIVHSPSDDDKK
jgi:hypothetical protein